MQKRTQVIVCIVLFLFAFGIRIYDLENMPTQDDEQLWLARSYAFMHTLFNAEPDLTPITRIYSDNGNVDVFETGDNLLPEEYPFTIRTEAPHPGIPMTTLIGLSYIFLADGSHPASLNLFSTIFAMKLPAVFLGSLLVLVTFMGAQYLFDWRVGLAAAILIAVSPLMIGFSRLARIDLSATLFATCMLFSYIVNVRQSTPKNHLQWSILAGVFAGLGMATTPYAVYIVPIFALVKIMLTPTTKGNWYRRFMPDVYDVLFFVIWGGVYFLFYPNLWANPVAGIGQWIDNLFVTYDGHMAGDVRRTLYLEMFLLTSVPLTLALVPAGILGKWSQYRTRIILMMVWFGWFLLLLSIPSGRKNIKNTMQLLIPIAILAGLGIDWLAGRLSRMMNNRSERPIYVGLLGLQIVVGLAITMYWHPLPHLYVAPGVYVPMIGSKNFATSNGMKLALDYAYENSPYPAERFIAPGARNNLLFHLPEDQLDYAVDGRYELADWLIVSPKRYEIGGDAWFFDTEPTHLLVHRQVEIAGLYYLPDFFPREQFDTSSPIIRYDNGIEIYDLQTDVTDNVFTLTSLWGQQPEDPYGFSIQIFDAEMNKIAQGDFLLPVEVKQVSKVELLDVPDGDYRVLLITYDLATATSQNGLNLTNEIPFERSYDLGTITIGQPESD